MSALLKCVSLVLLFMASSTASSQGLRSLDYTLADSIAINFDSDDSYDPGELARRLTAGLNSDANRFRVLYRWIADNIRYDYSAKSADPAKVLKKKEAVCAGYAYLLQELCAYAFIRCEVVSGYAKSHDAAVGRISNSNHAWNAVYLNDTWYLVDVTWSAGYMHKKSFVKSYSDQWFLADPVRFQDSHWPADTQWFLSEPVRSRRHFFRMPAVFEGFYHLGLEFPKQTSGFLKRKKKLILAASAPIESATFFSESEEASYPCLVEKHRDGYLLKFDERMESAGAYYLSVNGVVVLQFVM